MTKNLSLGYICPGEPRQRSPNAPKFEDRSQEKTEWQEQGAREAAWKLAKSVLNLEERDRAEDLGKHNVYTHFPKDQNCEICKRTKITRAPCRRRNGEAVPRAENFGDLITADHKVLSDNCESRNNHRCAVVVQDLATQWIQA